MKTPRHKWDIAISGAAAILVTIACASTPTIKPTPTPIPGFVAGEEDLAYLSFSKYYAEQCYKQEDLGNGELVIYAYDKSRSGRAVYVGDGIWRFHIPTVTIMVVPHEDPDDGYHSERELTSRSYPDKTWDNPCPRFPGEDDPNYDWRD